MAEAAAGAVVEEVVKCAAPPIKRGFNYLCCFTSNINNLKDEAKRLDDAAAGLQAKVGRARDNVEDILPEVKTLLDDDYNKIKAEKTAILDQVPNVGSVCLNLGARFSLSKRATKTAESMNKLREDCSHYSSSGTAISVPRPPAAGEADPLRNAYEFESRKKIEEDIMMVLREGDVSMIGISGMGGLGKTTMAKRIMNRVLEERVFEETVIAVFSQEVNKLTIQLEIGGQLGLKLEGETSEVARKQKLYARLRRGKKSILLVLDDVWEPIELEEFGIPCDSEGCSILVTSRNNDTLSKMNVQRPFGMKILSEDEARFLFRESAGTCMDDGELKSIAEDIVKECEGLPLALTAVGEALKGEKAPSVWRDALRQLRKCDPDIPSHIEKIYSKLRLSYDLLGLKHAKSLFLLCCLYPEDANIDVEELTCFGMGLGIFEGIGNLEEVRDRVFVSITLLKSRSLLMDSAERNHVRMHDMVRDVCIFIAKQEGRVEGDNCYWISSFEQRGEGKKQLPTGLGSPNLNLLFFNCRNYYPRREEAPQLDNTIFEGISDLRVLCIQNYLSLTSLPPTHSLKNLKSLVLDSCDGLKTISVVGKFVNLEILICRNSPLIEELPLEIKKLDRLKLLELTGCRKLQRIGKGIISSLHALEELKMLGSFRRWESEDREERKNAGIRELESLTNLRCVEIDIKDPAVASKMRLSSEIKKFKIRTGGRRPLGERFNKTMVLDFESKGTCIGNRTFEMELLIDTEVLYLTGNDASSVDLAKCQNVRRLELTDCETITLMVGVQASLESLMLRNLLMLEWICEDPISSNSFDNLKELKLVKLPVLKQLWKSSSGRPLFPNISSIKIEHCGSLCNLGELSIAGKDCLPQLEELTIVGCEMMEQVFLRNKEDEIRKDSESQNDHSIKKVFPKLKKVELKNMLNLVTFYQGIGGFEFPLLTEMSIKKCRNLKGMGCSVDIDDKSWHLFCRPKVSLCNLKELKLDQNPFCGHEIHESLLNGLEVLNLSSLPGSTSLFSSSVAGNLGKLRVLNIRKCDEMLKVIEDNKELVSGIAERPFPKLEELLLKDLPKLVAFCEWKCDVELHSLREVIIKGCPNMKNLSLGFLAAPKLVHFDSDFNNNLETEVSFISLKELEISGIEKPLYGHKFFNGLKELEVAECSMSCLFTSSTARHFDNLEVLSIRYCDDMVKVIEDEENEEKVASGGGERTLLFPKLRKLELVYLPKLVSFCEWKCDNQLPSLRNLVILDCPVLGILTTMFKAAPYLENVEINLKDIVGDRDNWNSVWQQLEYMARVKVSFNDHNYLSLSDQWNPFYGHQIHSSLLRLEDLTFSKLHGSTSLFSSSVAGNLVNLRRLTIEDCDEMLKVIEDKKDVDEKVVSGTAEMAHILFPKLEELSLEELSKLVTFCEWKCNDELPSLRKVTIKGCPDMEKLSFLRVVAAPNLEAFTTDFNHNLEIGVVDVSLDGLKKLVIRFRYSEQPLYGHKCFNGLKELQVSACSMSCLFTSSTARRLENLEVLSIKFCYEMVKVIEDEEDEEKVGSGGGERTLLFPQLKKLELVDLPKLVSFCEWKCDIEFPSLRDVNIHMCPDLQIFTMGSIAAAPNLVDVKINNEDGGDTNDMNSVARESMVSFDSLKKLVIKGSEKPLYGHKFFNGLEELHVFRCSMSCLFTSSTARHFDNLEVLSIKRCYRLVKVIEDEENEEKVGSGVGEMTLLFPKLRKLELHSLPKLESFCEWKCDIELPLLRDVIIWSCPVLRTFTMGSIAAAPKLENVQINIENIGSDTKELNSIAQENMKRTKRW